MSDERTDGRKRGRRRGGRLSRCEATLAGEIETGERNSLAFQFFKIYSDWPLIQDFARNRPRNLSPPSTQTLKLRRRRQRRLNYCLLSEIWKLIIVPARSFAVGPEGAADDRGAVDCPPDGGRVVIVVTDRSVPKWRRVAGLDAVGNGRRIDSEPIIEIAVDRARRCQIGGDIIKLTSAFRAGAARSYRRSKRTLRPRERDKHCTTICKFSW